MRTKKIDGRLFEQMLRNGLNLLEAHEKELNQMNVFPVADGDTGTNMLTTLHNGMDCARETDSLCDYLSALSSGMLLGARGNSGVILSQLFKGVYLELSRRTQAGMGDLRNAFIRAYKVAYEAVIHPQEGTILTVAREGIEMTARKPKQLSDAESFLKTYLSYMNVSLQKTPELLPVLKEMGVLDSGAKGYITIIQGMADWLEGIVHEPGEGASDAHRAQPVSALNFDCFNENSAFDEGYCMEFILQLLKTEDYEQDFSEARFTEALESMGNSLVVVRDGLRIKVHVHTKKPADIIVLAQRYGEFLTFKLENMQLQHNEHFGDAGPVHAEDAARRPVAVIAAANGDGMKKLFEDLGCQYVIDCGPTMNASTEEFLEAIRKVNAEHILVLPGNPNMMLAAQQAAKMSGEDVRVLEAKSIPQTYFALAMDLQDCADIEKRAELMQSGADNVDTVLIARAAKTFTHNGKEFLKDHWVAIVGPEPIASAEDPVEAIRLGLTAVDSLMDKETCVLFRGRDAETDLDVEIEQRLTMLNPMMELSFIDGGQAIYDWMIGLS